MVDTGDVDVRRVQELVGAIVDADVAHAAFHIADAATASLKSPQPSLDVFITELEGKLWKSADEIMTIKEVLVSRESNRGRTTWSRSREVLSS